MLFCDGLGTPENVTLAALSHQHSEPSTLAIGVRATDLVPNDERCHKFEL